MTASEFDLSGKVVLVTGGTRGIGWECARVMTEHGATLIVTGKSDEARIASRLEELNGIKNGEHFGSLTDSTDFEQVKALFTTIAKRYQRLDVLVNNAGIMNSGLISMATPQSLQAVIDANVNSCLYAIHFASRLMARKRNGSIINMGSIVGRFGSAGQIAYSASKSALIGMTLAAAKELGSSNIRVNCIAPGFIDTDLIKDFDEPRRAQVIQSISLKRIGRPSDVAKATLFLASDLSAYISGQVLGVDGAMVI